MNKVRKKMIFSDLLIGTTIPPQIKVKPEIKVSDYSKKVDKMFKAKKHNVQVKKLPKIKIKLN